MLYVSYPFPPVTHPLLLLRVVRVCAQRGNESALIQWNVCVLVFGGSLHHFPLDGRFYRKGYSKSLRE